MGFVKTMRIVPIISSLITIFIFIGCADTHGEAQIIIKSLNLINNESSKAHPWEKIQGFLESDDTEEENYSIDKGAGYFAEKLHNRGEYYGFKTAVVIVECEEGDVYVLNAFDTVDYGVVFVDCTGHGRFERNPPKDIVMSDYTKLDYGSANAYLNRLSFDLPNYFDLARHILQFPKYTKWDKIAYVKEGEKIGFSSIDFEQPNFSYDWYVENIRPGYAFDLWESLRNIVNDHRERFKVWFEKEVPNLTRVGFKSPTGKFYDLLIERENIIDTMYFTLDLLEPIINYYWEESLSPVADVTIRW